MSVRGTAFKNKTKSLHEKTQVSDGRNGTDLHHLTWAVCFALEKHGD